MSDDPNRPEFIVDPFNVEAGSWEGYRRFIEKLRRLVAERYSHNRAVAPVEVNPPTRFFDMVLQTRNHSVTFRLRRDNLYLVGYQMRASGDWLELRYDDNNPEERITGSTRLRFGDTYPQLLTTGGVVNSSFTNIQAGRQELINAITSLATSYDDRVRARSLIVVLIMIVESVRFDAITDHFSGQTGSETAPIPEWIEEYVRGWATLSYSLLHHDADNSFRLPVPNNFGNIRSFVQAVAIIGILKGRYFGPPSRDYYPQGRPLLELLSVKIDFIHGKENYLISAIYGKIKVSDGLSDEVVYNVHTNDHESIRPGDYLSLNSPPRCFTAYDSFTIDVTLMCREGLSEDDEISKGNILWEVTNISKNKYDKLLSQEVKGLFGIASLSYAVLSDAVQALVEVTLVRHSSSYPASVYGELTYHNISLDNQIDLFRKASNRFITVKVGELIPLSKSVVAAPLNSNFVIRVDLKGSNVFSSDDEIAKGTPTFHPQLSGTNEQTISGKNGQIRVKVTWAWYVA